MSEQLQFEDHESLDRLLPWFVNDSLGPLERERVRRHLEVCDACRQSAALLSVVQSTVRHDTAIPIVPPPRADRLLEAIDGFDKRRHRPQLPGIATVIAASLAVVLLAAALLIAARDPGTTPSRYETATSSTHPATMDYVLVVQFESGTPLVEQQRVLHDLEARDINRGEPDGAYRVTVSLAAASLAELEQFTSDVEALPQIQSASVTALQFPVQRQP
jgi:anti-sigma factor RsiW